MAKGNKQSWTQVAAIAVVALLLVGVVYAVMEWQRNRPGTPLADQRVDVTSGTESRSVAPYTVCELDEECAGGEPPTMPLAGDTVTFTVADEVAASSWRLLLIYDDPAANTERVFTSGESTEETVEAVTDTGARLVVGEVSALAVDRDDAGEEIPVIATWSVGFDS